MKIKIYLDKNTTLFELKSLKQCFYNVENRLNLSAFTYTVKAKKDDYKKSMTQLYEKYDCVLGYKIL